MQSPFVPEIDLETVYILMLQLYCLYVKSGLQVNEKGEMERISMFIRKKVGEHNYSHRSRAKPLSTQRKP